jgi:hypothetical protein
VVRPSAAPNLADRSAVTIFSTKAQRIIQVPTIIRSAGSLMRITRLELRNFRCISHLVLENLPETIVLVSANGLGKSTILEAIAGAHDLVVPYHQEQYPFKEHWQGNSNTSTWPPHLRKPVRFGSEQATLAIEVQPNDHERVFLQKAGCPEELGKAEFVIEQGRYIKRSDINEAIKKLFEYHSPALGVGFLDYIQPIRYYANQVVGNINTAGSDNEVRSIVSSFHRGLGDTSKWSTLRSTNRKRLRRVVAG